MLKKVAIFALGAAVSAAAFGASKVRLIYGEGWSRAGMAVKKTLTSSAFKSAAKGRYVVECIPEKGGGAAKENFGSLKLPAIFLISDGGNCYCVLDNVPATTTADKFVATFNKADKIRLEAEKTGFNTPDQCGEFLQKMERYVGGPRRIISKGFYEHVFNKLKQLDPSDSTGWQRHFTLGIELSKHTKADGLELVIKANEFREKKKFSEGQTFIDNEKKKPRKHLTHEQVQALLMAEFALFREDNTKKEYLDNLLRKVAEFDETTLWGTAAVGWLNLRGNPPLSTYWGWRGEDFKGAQFKQVLKYGVSHCLQKPGKYTIKFISDGGASVRFETLTMMAGKEVVKELKNPTVDSNVTTFEFDLTREYQRGRITSILVRGNAANNGGSKGKIRIERRVLRPRKEAK